MEMIIIKPNTKDIEGFLVPLCFFEGKTYLKEKKEHTSILQCVEKEIEVLNEYIVKPHF